MVRVQYVFRSRIYKGEAAVVQGTSREVPKEIRGQGIRRRFDVNGSTNVAGAGWAGALHSPLRARPVVESIGNNKSVLVQPASIQASLPQGGM